MDDFVKQKLEQWNLLEYSTYFESEGIDEESFKLIDAETLKILIPKAGPRLKFKMYLNNFLSSVTNGPCESLSAQNLSSILNSSDNNCASSDSSLNDSFLSIQPEPFLTPIDSSVFQNEHCLSNVDKKTKEFDIHYIVERKLPEIVKKLNGNDPAQINILDKYKMNRIIVDTYIEKYGCRPTTKEKIEMARDIITTFPILKSTEGEGFEQWFCPGVKGTTSSGFIAQRFRNYRLRKLSSVERSELGIGENFKSPKRNATPILGCEDNSIDFLQKQQWLKENDQPTEKVLQLMQETLQGRRFQISSGYSGNIIQSWPRILNPQVIDAEFTEIYGEKKGDSLCLEFGLIATHIIQQAKHCGRKEAEEIANTVDLNLSITTSSASTENICCAILLLPLLLPQGVFMRQDEKKIKKKKLRPTSAQSLDHFVQFIPIGEGIEKFMKEDRLLGGERKQPFILAIGEKNNPIQTFVVFEENCIAASSLLKGVDLCFKLTYILNLEFSSYCRNVWNFINDIFYKCEFDADIPSCVLELKNRLFVNVK